MRKIVTVILCLSFLALCFADVENFASASWRGILLFATAVLPVLFPFFVITAILTSLDMFKYLNSPCGKTTKLLFGTDGNSAGVLALSLISGYPNSARILSQMYAQGSISRSQAIKASTFTSTTSPIFVIATVGIYRLASARMGVIIFIAHTLGAILTGIMMRNIKFRDKICDKNELDFYCINRPSSYNKNEPTSYARNELNSYGKHEPSSYEPTSINSSSNNATKIELSANLGSILHNNNLGTWTSKQTLKDEKDILSSAINTSVQNIFAVGGLIVLFFILCSQLEAVFMLNHTSMVIISSILEMTNGVFALSQNAHPAIICAVISFGGLSVAMQGYIFFKDFHMPFAFYILYKVIHTALATLSCMLLFVLF